MNCPNCNRSNAPNRNFCGSCGTPLAMFCSRCGFRNGTDDRYCGGCGRDLAASAGAQPALAGDEPTATPADELGELLEAAQEADALSGAGGDVRVTQDDIDELFGD